MYPCQKIRTGKMPKIFKNLVKSNTVLCDIKTSYSTQLKMLPNDNVSMSVRHLDHIIETLLLAC